MNVIFKDDRVIDEHENDLLVYDKIDNSSLYLFIDNLIKNQENVRLIKDFNAPFAEKFYEIISEEFQVNGMEVTD